MKNYKLPILFIFFVLAASVFGQKMKPKVPGRDARSIPITHKLTEEFSDYKEINGITLPHLYQLNLLIDNEFVADGLFTTPSMLQSEWKFYFSEFLFNQKLDPDSFKIK